MKPTVHVHRHAFETMIQASIEMFKRECYGPVFGRTPTKSKKHFIITHASSSQCHKKLHTCIIEHSRSERRLRGFFSVMPPHSRPIGYFHSHPEWGHKRYKGVMSTTDIISMTREKGKIVFIIEIFSRKRGAVLWQTQPNGSVRGSFRSRSNNYNFNIHAYTLEYRNNEPKPKQIKIIATEAIKTLNRALGYSS